MAFVRVRARKGEIRIESEEVRWWLLLLLLLRLMLAALGLAARWAEGASSGNMRSSFERRLLGSCLCVVAPVGIMLDRLEVSEISIWCCSFVSSWLLYAGLAVLIEYRAEGEEGVLDVTLNSLDKAIATSLQSSAMSSLDRGAGGVGDGEGADLNSARVAWTVAWSSARAVVIMEMDVAGSSMWTSRTVSGTAAILSGSSLHTHKHTITKITTSLDTWLSHLLSIATTNSNKTKRRQGSIHFEITPPQKRKHSRPLPDAQRPLEGDQNILPEDYLFPSGRVLIDSDLDDVGTFR